MALINCPQCGKSVSDSAEICVHCGYNFYEVRKAEEDSKEYGRLPEEEQKKLAEEYSAIDAGLKKCGKRVITNLICIVVDLFMIIAGLVIGCVLFFTVIPSNRTMGMYVLVFLFLAIAIAGTVWSFILRRNMKTLNRKAIEENKKFEYWLKTSKQINYHPILDEDEKKIYDAFKVE